MTRMLILAMGVAGIVCGIAHGDIITFEFRGSVTSNDLVSGLFADAQVDEPVTFRYSFDTGADPFGSSEPPYAVFPMIDLSYTVSVGNTLVTDGSYGEVAYGDNVDLGEGGVADVFLPIIGFADDSGGAGVSLLDSTSSFLDEIPGHPPSTLDLTNFDSHIGFIWEGPRPGPDGPYLFYSIDELTIVPAPGALVALASIPRSRRRRTGGTAPVS